MVTNKMIYKALTSTGSDKMEYVERALKSNILNKPTVPNADFYCSQIESALNQAQTRLRGKKSGATRYANAALRVAWSSSLELDNLSSSD